MKRIFKNLMFAAMGAIALASCEDVPAPYVVPVPGGDASLYKSTSLSDWSSLAAEGLIDPWSKGASYTQATGYQKWDGATTKSNKECGGYLISPAFSTNAESITAAKAAYVAFEYCVAYANNDPQYLGHIKMYASTSSDGTAFVADEWTELDFKATFTSTDWTLKTEKVQLPEEFVGKENVRIAYWFACPADKSSTFELKTFSLNAGSADSGDNPDPDANDGSATKPFEVADLKANQTGAEVWVHGYIVGSIPQAPEGVSYQLKDMTFTTENASTTNICIAASSEETDYANCVAVQVTTGARSALTLASVPDNLGKEVWLKGTSEKYFGSAGLKNVSKYSFTQPEEEQIVPAGDPKGTGTKDDPWNVAAALKYIKALASTDSPTDEFYTKGKISEVVKKGNSGSIQFRMSDDGTANNELLVYYCDNLGKKPFEALTDLKAGDEVIVCGKVKNYNGNTPEYNSGSYLVYLNGKSEYPEGDSEGDDQGTSTTSDYMSIASLPQNITVGNYGTQNVSDEKTWLSWTWNGVDFKGAKICKATDSNGAGIQMQGNASDAAKQGFIFNSSAWSTDISKITIVLKVASTAQYDPSYTLYAGSEAHPTSGEITPSSSSNTEGNFKVYTQVFDLSNANARYFTIANNLAGVLYIDKITVE